MEQINFNPLLTGNVLPEEEFENREMVKGFENRKNIKIIKQSADAMEVDITEPLEAITKNGTPVNAQVMNTFKSVIGQADTNASTAHRVAEVAYNNSLEAWSKANTAEQVSSEAKLTAETTQSQFEDLANQVTLKQGTKVTNGSQDSFMEYFDASTKTDKTTFETAVQNLSAKDAEIENKPIIKNVSYDSSEDKFIF